MALDGTPYITSQGLLGHLADDGSAVVGLLLIGAPKGHIADARFKVLKSGAIILRFGVALTYEVGEYFLPNAVLDDYQMWHHSADAIRFLLKRGEQFPRSDVIGYRATDGQQRTLFVKEIDLGFPLRVLAYPNLDAWVPLSVVDCVIQVTSTATATVTGIPEPSELDLLKSTVLWIEVDKLSDDTFSEITARFRAT